MRFHTQTAGVSLTAQQPLNNIVRTAIEALAGVLGGTQSLHTNSYDEALALPTEEAARIALRTQQIIAHETGVTNTIDPLGGAYFVEALTDQLEREAYDYFSRIDELGGMVEAVKQNFPQREIADAAFALQCEYDSGERILVGVNDYVDAGDEEIPTLRIDPELERKQRGRLAAVRARRDGGAVERTLAALRADAAQRAREPHAGAAGLRPRPRLARARSCARCRTSSARTPRRRSSERRRAGRPRAMALRSIWNGTIAFARRLRADQGALGDRGPARALPRGPRRRRRADRAQALLLRRRTRRSPTSRSSRATRCPRASTSCSRTTS